VVAVEGVGCDGVEVVAVGDERMVSPQWEQAGLGGVGEAGATDHQPDGAAIALSSSAADIAGLRDLGVAAVGVVDLLPGVVGDLGDRGLDLGSVGDGDRPGHVMPVQGAEQFP
jgi:hypothetical protein